MESSQLVLSSKSLMVQKLRSIPASEEIAADYGLQRELHLLSKWLTHAAQRAIHQARAPGPGNGNGNVLNPAQMRLSRSRKPLPTVCALQELQLRSVEQKAFTADVWRANGS